jgi:hypothetical protein
MFSKLTTVIIFLLIANFLIQFPLELAKAGTVEDTTGKTTFYGVFVGIEDTGFEGAKKVRDKLLAVPNGGWKPENAKLIDKGTATAKAISDAINDIKAKAKPGDEFLFYFIGHGANGWISPGPNGVFETAPEGDDVFTKGRTGIMPGSNGKLETKPKGDDVLVGPKDTDKDEPGDAVDNWIGVDNKEHITDDDLAKMLSGFPYSVSIVIVLDACFTASFTDGTKDLPSITEKKAGVDVRACKVQFMGVKALEPDETLTAGFIDGLDWLPAENTTRADSDGNKNNVTDTREIFRSSQSGTWEQWQALNFDNDKDNLVDEDAADHFEKVEVAQVPDENGTGFIEVEQFVVQHLLIDDDADGLIDEDPDPAVFAHLEWGAPIFSSDMVGTPKEAFAPGENVYVTVANPKFELNVTFYVVANQTIWSNGDVLNDLSGGIEFGILMGIEDQTFLIWVPPLVGGNYDIIMDVNLNGVFDEGVDQVDSILVASSQVNLLFEDGFENNFVGWTATYDSPTIVSSPVYSGDKAMLCSNPYSSQAYISGFQQSTMFAQAKFMLTKNMQGMETLIAFFDSTDVPAATLMINVVGGRVYLAVMTLLPSYSYAQYDVTDSLSANTWFSVALESSPSSCTIYFNGIAVQNISNRDIPSISAVSVGMFWGTGDYQGTLAVDNARIGAPT